MGLEPERALGHQLRVGSSRKMSRLTPARLRPLLVNAGRQHHRSVEGDVNIFKTLAALAFPSPAYESRSPAVRLTLSVTVKQQACGHDGTFTEDLPTCTAKFKLLHTPAVTISMNAVIGNVTNRNRPGSGVVPIGV